MWLNGPTQWEDHRIGKKTSKQFKRPIPNRAFVLDHTPSPVKRNEQDTVCYRTPDHYVLQTSLTSMNMGDLWCDSGCVRAVGGKEQHAALKKHMAKFGLKPIQKSCQESFQFGNGQISYAIGASVYPVFVQGKYRGMLDIAEVPDDCPLLLSKSVLKKWDVDLCFGKGCMNINKFGVIIPFNEQEVPIVNITDVTKVQLSQQWSNIPDLVKMADKTYLPTSRQ